MEINDCDGLFCKICCKKYKNKKLYNAHIKRNSCKIKNNGLSCFYCNKNFATKYVRKTHEDKCFQKNITEIDSLKDRIRLLEKSSEIQSIQINTPHITNNSNNNIFICKFGEETIEHITKKQIVQLFNKCFGSIPEFAKLTYFNKNVPENCNVYLPHIKDKYACFFNGDKWEMKRRDDIINNIYETAEAFLIDKFEDLKEGIGIETLKKYTRWLNEHTTDEHENFAKERIKLLLYNEKEMVIELRKTQNKMGRLESCIISFNEY
jgi:hypothetical protein